MKPHKIRIVIEYDGTDFAGWQLQPDARTVQGEIEKAIQAVVGEKRRIFGAGRTDSGVHARGQVAHFSTKSRLEPKEWVGALNANLPPDVRILDAENTPLAFDARRSARGKWYRYEILNRPVRPAIDRRHVWHIEGKLDVDAMKRAAQYLLGEHDFSSFRGKGCDAKNTRRAVRRLDVQKTDEERIVTDLEATAFLKHMARNIVGTLVEVGRGRLQPSDMERILKLRDRKEAGPTAPAQGLTLMKVFYDDEIEK